MVGHPPGRPDLWSLFLFLHITRTVHFPVKVICKYLRNCTYFIFDITDLKGRTHFLSYLKNFSQTKTKKGLPVVQTLSAFHFVLKKNLPNHCAYKHECTILWQWHSLTDYTRFQKSILNEFTSYTCPGI